MTSPVQNLFSTVQSWFKARSSPDLVECSEVSPPVVQAAPPTLHSSTRLDKEEVELLKVVNHKGESSLKLLPISPDTSTLSYDTLATFSGFTTAQVQPPPPHSHTSPPQSGHQIKTAHEKARKAELLSPPNIRRQMRSGFRSTFDKFFHEKDIAKRILSGGIVKHRRGKQQNAFQYSAQLADRDVYRQLLEKHTGTVVKYSVRTNRTNILFDKENLTRKGSLLGTLDVTAGVDSVDTSKIVTSTTIKPLITSTTIKPTQGQVSNSSRVPLEASPMLLPREKVQTAKTDFVRSSLASPRTPTVMTSSRAPQGTKSPKTPVLKNSLEQQLACEEVYSPKYLAKLMDKYGAVAREREKQIQREEEKKLKCEKETDELFDSIDERLKSHLKITQVALPEAECEDEVEDEDQPTELPELTEDMMAVIRRAERSRGEVLVNAHKIQITVKDIGTLRGLNWLNDEIINFYMQMIVTRSGTGKFCSVYAFTTFFYPKLSEGGHSTVKRWTKKVDIFSHSLILVPVHLGMHWCLATMDMTRKVITYYDSMGGNNTKCLKSLAEYLKEEHLDKKGTPLDLANWSQVIAKQIPQQMNGSDCGMFACKFAEYLSRRAKITFSQQDMPYFRRRMIYEIVKNTLLHP
eukprot:GFUD01035660.1.p1 GENE.GFUD01035660.1~~GFUD01035660.1.p1  ORF type:complete len:633 (-),score=244.13 GFUD01035660.1:234-2132(-)